MKTGISIGTLVMYGLLRRTPWKKRNQGQLLIMQSDWKDIIFYYLLFHQTPILFFFYSVSTDPQFGTEFRLIVNARRLLRNSMLPVAPLYSMLHLFMSTKKDWKEIGLPFVANSQVEFDVASNTIVHIKWDKQ